MLNNLRFHVDLKDGDYTVYVRPLRTERLQMLQGLLREGIPIVKNEGEIPVTATAMMFALGSQGWGLAHTLAASDASYREHRHLHDQLIRHEGKGMVDEEIAIAIDILRPAGKVWYYDHMLLPYREFEPIP